MAGTWSLVQGGSATYTDGGGNSLAIFGLSIGLSAADMSTVVDVTDYDLNNGVTIGTIQLKAGALPTANLNSSSSIRISGTEFYKLALDAFVEEYDENAQTVLSGDVTGGGSITIQKDHTAGWQLATGGMSVVYIADGANTTLATVTGLSAGAASANISLSGANILFKAGALSIGGTVQISGDQASSFSLKLTSDGTTAADSLSGTSLYANSWEDATDGSNDDIYYISDTTKEYWKVDNNQIAYHEGGKSMALRISGLAASISAALLNSSTSSPIKLTSNVFSMSAAALSGTKAFKLTNGSGSGVAEYGYSLSLASDVARWSKDTIISGDSISTAGTAYIQAKEYAGWGIDGVNYSLHTAASDTLATISGLSKIAKLNANGISLASASSIVITLGVSAFDTTTAGNVVTIANKSAHQNYSLSLAAGVSYTAFDAAGGSHVLAVNGTSATVYRTQVSGYTASSGLSIGYTVGQKVTLASITGMTSAGDNKITLNNTSENNDKGTVLTIAQVAFDAHKTITLTDEDSTDDKNFLLSISSAVTDLYDDTGNIQFDIAGVSTKGEALLVNFHEGGWSLAGTSGATMTVSYGASKSDTLATISGLSTKNVVIGATGLSIASQSSAYILLGVSAFGTAANRTVSIVDNDANDGKLYSLSLAAALKSKVGIGGKLENNPYLSIVSATGSSTALVMQGLSAGYSVLSSSTAISYTASSAITLAKITGLSAGATSSVLELNERLIKFKKGALNSSASSVVSITDEFDESSLSKVIDSYTQNFTYSIALDTTTAGKSFAAADLYDQTGVVSLSGISAGKAYVVNTHSAGWKWSGTSGVYTINYAGQSIDTLATITGLSTGATAEHLSLSGSVTGGASLITLKLGALNSSISKMVRLVDNNTSDKYNYTLSLAAGYSTAMYDVDGKISLSFAGIAGGSAHVVNTHAAGWSMIGSTSTVINYEDTFVDPLATITGLANAASLNNNASLSNNVVTLNSYAITDKSITLVNAPSAAEGTYYNYTLSLAGTSTGVLGFKVNNNYWSTSNGNTAVYQYDTNKGWKLGSFSTTTHSISIAYTPKTTTQLATITNLTNLDTITGANGAIGISGITVSGDSIGSYSGTITLNKNVLSTQAMTFTNATGASYGLSLGADVSAAGAIEAASIGAHANGKRLITATLAGGYSIVTGGIRYTAQKTGQTVATITGLNTSKTLPTGSVSINVKDNVITLGMSALASGAVSLANANLIEGYVGGYSATGTTSDKYKFTLAMAGGASKLGFTDGEDKWVVDKDTPADGTAAVLQYTTSEGWSLSSNSLAFTYAGASDNTIVRITHLNDSITAAGNSIAGINVVAHVNDDPATTAINENKAGTITLDRSVLGTVSGAANSSVFTIKQFKVGSSDTDMYTIGINQDSLSSEYVPTVKSDDVQRWTFTRNGATFSTYDSEYWTLKNKTITYSGESDVRTHATFTGLVTTDPGDSVRAGAISIAYTNDSHSAGTIYLGKGVLSTVNASISSATGNSFTIAALSTGSYAVSAPTLTNAQWKVSSTTAQYTGKVTEGYEATKAGTQLIYSKASDNAIVAAVTGLKQGLVAGTSGVWIGVGKEGESTVTKSLQLDTTTRIITLSKAVLGTENVSVTGTDYTLRLGGDVNTTNSYSNVWHVGSSSYTYDSVRSAYYTLGTGSTSIQATGESIVSHLAYITGLKSGLTTDDDGQIAGISVGTNKKIYLSKSVLNTTTDATGKAITEITNAGSNTYSITGASDVSAPTAEDNLTWKVSSGTATRTGTMNEGWIFAANGSSATYYKKDTAFTFATIKGLNSKVTAAVLNGSTGLTLGSKSAAVKAVTLSTNVLGGTSVTVSGSSDPRVGTNYGGYSLVLNTSDSASYTGLRSKAVAADIWAADSVGTTYTYKNVNLDYYSLASGDKPTIASYVAQKDNKTYATFTNLKKGLVDASAPSTIAGVSVISKVITFNEVSRADTDSNVSVATFETGYSVSLAAAIKPYDDGEKYWITNSDNNLTTAIYQSDVTGGYSYSGTSKVIYYIKDQPNERAKLTGLRDGLKVMGSGSIAGISIGTTSADSLKITLARDVLTTSSVTLTGSDAYSITSVTNGDISTSIKTAWTGEGKNATSATLVSYTPAKYVTVSGGKGVTYTKESIGSAIATISGLKKGTVTLGAYDDGQIAGISVGNKVVTLSNNVLDKKNVSLVNDSTVATSMYSLAVDSSGDDSVAGASGVWQWAFNKSKGTATYNYSIVGGYAVGSTSATTDKKDLIVYTPNKTLKTTITNLKNTVTVSSGVNNSIGIKQGDEYTGITGYNFALSSGVGFSATDTTSTISGTITLASEVLNSKNVTISSNNAKVGSFLLGLAEKDVAADQGKAWNKTSTTTDKATYEQTTAAGYTLADDSKSITYSSTATTKVLATLTGLKKTVVAQGGLIDGITVTDGTYANVAAGISVNTPGIITIDTNVLSNANLTLGKTDNFNLSLAGVGTSVAVSLGTANYSRDSLNSTTDAAALSFAVKYADPTWTYNASKGTAALNVGTTEGWALTRTSTGATSSADDDEYKQITYTAAKPVNIANITGLAKNLSESAFENGVGLSKLGGGDFTSREAVGMSKGTMSGVVSITTKDVLTNANLKIAVAKGQTSNYNFTLGISAADLAPTNGENMWSVAIDKKGSLTGTATYQYGTTQGWTLNSGSGTNDLKDTLTYSAAKTTTLATLTNLDKKSDILNAVVKGKATGKATTVSVSSIEGLDVGAAYGLSGGGSAAVITVSDIDLFGKNKVTLTNGKNTGIAYSLSLGEEVASKATADAWSIASNGTVAYYKNMRTAGYTLNGTSTVATYNTESATNTLFTLKGLKKGNTLAQVTAGIDVAGDNVYVHDAVTGTTNITLTQGKIAAGSTSSTKYQFATDYISTPTLSAPKFNPKTGGTVTLTQVTSEGFTLGANGKQGDNTLLKYSKQKTTTLATIKGLNATTEGTGKNKKSLLTVGSDSSSGTPVSVVNLKTTLAGGSVVYPTVLTYDDEINTITVKKDALIAKNVTITSQKTNPYTLVIGDDVPTYAEETTEWVVSGTTGSYKTYDKAYYTYKQDKNGEDVKTTITYHKPTAGTTYAKVTNLFNNTSLSAGSVSTAGYDFVTKGGVDVSGDTGGVLTLDKDKLTANKSIALTGNDGYILQLGDDFKSNEVSTLEKPQWTASKGTVTAKATRTAGYDLAFGMKSVTYNKSSKPNQVVAKLTGLATTLTGTNAVNPDSSNVITLNDAQLAKKNVVLSTSQGDINYTLKLDSVSAPEITKTNQPIKKGTLTLTGEVTQAGYVLGSSSTAITYVKASASKTNKTTGDVTYTPYTLATFKGVEDTTTLDLNVATGSEPTASIKGVNLNNTSTITPGAFKVEITGTFKDKLINGSANADSFVLSDSATNVTVNTGKGNDYVDLGTGKGNVFVYANGNGNDVVEHFDLSNNKFKLTSGTLAAERDGEDIVVKVGSGNVILKDAYGSDETAIKQLTVLNSKNAESTYTIYPNTHKKVDSAGLIDSDNYSTDPVISDIVTGDQGSVTDFNFNFNTMGTTGMGMSQKQDFMTSFASSNKK